MTGLNNPNLTARISHLGFKDPQRLNAVYNVNEFVVNWLQNTVTVHDGQTAGGAFNLANATLSNVPASTIMNKINSLSPEKIQLTGFGTAWFSENGNDSNSGSTTVNAFKAFTTAYNTGANIIATLDSGTMRIPSELTVTPSHSYVILYAPLKTITWNADWTLPSNVIIICDGFYSDTNVCTLNGYVQAKNADKRTGTTHSCVVCTAVHGVETLIPLREKYYSTAPLLDYSKTTVPNWSDIVDKGLGAWVNHEMTKNGTVYMYFSMGTDDNHRPNIVINDTITIPATRFITINEPDFGWSVNTFNLAKGDKIKWTGSAGGFRLLCVYTK